MNGYVIIADTDGNIVWYQDPRDDTGRTDAVIGGLGLTRPDKHILLLDSKDTLLEYNLDGDVLQKLERDAGDFDDADGVRRFVHHDLKREGDHTYVITAREYDYTDVNDCDGDGDVSEALTYILDGVMVFDHTTDPWTPVPSLEWSLSDIYDPSDCTGPQPPSCSATLWSSEGMTGCDWAHANSIWTDSDGTWQLSFKDQDKLINVDEATGGLVWELAGDGVSGDLLLDTSASIADPEFDNQHHAWRTATPNHIMLYDNNVTGAADPRALELSLSPAAGVYAVIADWPTPPLEPRGDCNSKGSAFDMLPSGHVVATCAPSGIIREFEPAGAEVWKLTLGCPDTTLTPSGNLYRAMPFNFGP
ncbi:MAG: hypothetical protein D6798_06310 [Deltaproteobacteria bacterium]|nr:MAG: hypothetical protein D6798_06310 [Deltaproteobacteria bacterium]